jgi:acetyl esterase
MGDMNTVSLDPQWVDPQAIELASMMRAKGLAPLSLTQSSVMDCRRAIDQGGAFLSAPIPALTHEKKLTIKTTQAAIPCKLYRPDDVAKPGLLIYAHGGSFALGSLDAWDGVLRDLVRGSGVAVLSVDYRLAPEHPFPAAWDDMVAVVHAVLDQGQAWGIDPQKIAIGGDSAGAHLALSTCLSLRPEALLRIKFMLLFYGMYSQNIHTPAWQQFGQGQYGLSIEQVQWMQTHCLDLAQHHSDWRLNPVHADLHRLPPAFMAIGSLDPLQDDHLALSTQLQRCQIPCEQHVYPGLAHGFIRNGPWVQSAQRAVSDAAKALARALAV